MLRKIKPIFLCLLTGVLLSLPFNNGKLWILAWFGFVPAFFALNNRSLKEAFFLFFFTGIIFWWATIYWLVHVTLAGTIVLVFYLALYFAIFGLVIRPFTRHSRPYVLIFIPSAWVLLEFIRSYLMTGFPWALLGYSQYLNLPVIQIADITGAWGISFLLILSNAAIVEMIWSARRGLRPRLRIVAILFASFLFLTLCYGYYRLQQTSRGRQPTPVKVSVIQANIPQELKWAPEARLAIIDKYFQLTKQASQDKADLIVWPEAALPIIPGEDPQLFEGVRYFVKEEGIPLLLGAVTSDGISYYNSALLISGAGEVSAEYSKIHLVPFGEYIPLRRLLPFLETVVPIGDVRPGDKYTVFSLKTNFSPDTLNFSVLVCFEDVFPELARRFRQRGAEILVNITNDGWYKETPAAYQHLQASVLRAVENRVSLVRSANTGVSAFINPKGKIVSTVRNVSGKEIFVSGYRTDMVTVAGNQVSSYTKFGDVFVLACFIIFILGVFISQGRNRPVDNHA